MLAIQLDIFTVILLLLIAGHSYFNFDRKEPVQKLFFALIMTTIFLLVLEIASVLFNAGYYSHSIIAHKLIDTLGFTLAPLVPVIIGLYIYKRANKYKKIRLNKYFWLGIPIIASSILSIGSYHFNWIFSITSENIYVRGPLFFVSPLTGFFYYAVSMLLLIDSRRKFNKDEFVALSLFSVIPSFMAIFQLYYFIYLTIWNSVAIAIVINYISFLHRQTKLDPLTGLGNRLAYDEYLANFANLYGKRKIVLSVVNIDLDNFKTINDIYGHYEGDKVLSIFARKLKDVFEEIGVPIRVGGDEFIILVNENRKEIMEEYVKTLIENIGEYNRTSGKPYQINFSYGMTIFDNTYNSLHELIQHSDKLMYEEKQNKGAGNFKNDRNGVNQ